MSDKEISGYVGYFVLAPFLIGAVVHFAPWWVGVPCVAVFGLLWLGVLGRLMMHGK